MTERIETFDTSDETNGSELQLKTAGFWLRFWAFLLDSLVISAIVGITVRPLFALMDWDVTGGTWYAPFTLISGAIFYTYFVFMTKFFKQTLGKMVFGLRVEKDNGEPLDWLTVLFREGVGRYINGCLLHFPYVIVAFTPKNKSLADYFSDTVVVHENIYVQNV